MGLITSWWNKRQAPRIHRLRHGLGVLPWKHLKSPLGDFAPRRLRKKWPPGFFKPWPFWDGYISDLLKGLSDFFSNFGAITSGTLNQLDNIRWFCCQVSTDQKQPPWVICVCWYMGMKSLDIFAWLLSVKVTLKVLDSELPKRFGSQSLPPKRRKSSLHFSLGDGWEYGHLEHVATVEAVVVVGRGCHKKC